MATNPKPTPQTAKPASTPAVKPAAATPTTRFAAEKKPVAEPVFLFDKQNYYLMFGGLALMLLSLFLMAGGKSPDPHQFKYDEIYSFQRITLAPILLLLGCAVEIYAIMKKPKTSTAN